MYGVVVALKVRRGDWVGPSYRQRWRGRTNWRSVQRGRWRDL